MANGEGSDTAGPLLGWSMAGLGSRPMEDLLDFPCVFRFKAVGVAAHGFVRDVLARVGTVIGRAVREDEHTVRASSQGRYESVTVELVVHTGDEIYEIYEAMRGEDSRIRFLL
jgi:putative lipoic acid-binding regulatory protein